MGKEKATVHPPPPLKHVRLVRAEGGPTRRVKQRQRQGRTRSGKAGRRRRSQTEPFGTRVASWVTTELTRRRRVTKTRAVAGTAWHPQLVSSQPVARAVPISEHSGCSHGGRTRKEITRPLRVKSRLVLHPQERGPGSPAPLRPLAGSSRPAGPSCFSQPRVL